MKSEVTHQSSDFFLECQPSNKMQQRDCYIDSHKFHQIPHEFGNTLLLDTTSTIAVMVLSSGRVLTTAVSPAARGRSGPGNCADAGADAGCCRSGGCAGGGADGGGAEGGSARCASEAKAWSCRALDLEH